LELQANDVGDGRSILSMTEWACQASDKTRLFAVAVAVGTLAVWLRAARAVIRRHGPTSRLLVATFMPIADFAPKLAIYAT
jgi:hypothetical protein